MGYYKKVWVPSRRKNGYRKRYKNQQKRKDVACGLIILTGVGLGAAGGGWGGAALGLLITGLITMWICNNPNP